MSTPPSRLPSLSAPPRDPAEYFALLAPLRCDRAVRCGEIGASERERCLREQPRARVLLGVERGLQAGRYRFDPARAAACLRLLAEAACAVDHEVLPAGCLGGAVPAGLLPAVAPGGACERWEECIDGRCTGELGCPGQCRAHTPAAGGPCGADTLCSDGLYCDRDVCRPRGDLGAPCDGHWHACRPGLVCQGYVAPVHEPHAYRRKQLGVCEARPDAGRPCHRVSLGHDCAPAQFCDFSAAEPRCRARSPAGAACSWQDACADGLRCDGLRLSAAVNGAGERRLEAPGVCRPVADADAPCDPAAAETRCPIDMRCGDDGRCRPRGDTGATCRERNDCGPYHHCEPATRTCQPDAALGEPCRPDRGGGRGDAGPCFLGACDPAARRCVGACSRGN
ncbi:hypothetical protein SAMN02745121_06763 [Nannocystis exedens]|uniref:Dickkopf N-terminal cysteine-rich domain-containing protein n=1 Tax=Nannocystis exedens TaxID=54 RepID=A0A1I2FQI9_9BACT|nr:hypothetical protein SAMN02745121_06763 [Nannocystis exedens]